MAEVHAQSGAPQSGITGGRRLQEVDVLRGLAALTVTLGHYIPFWDRYIGEIPVIVPNAAGNYSVRLFYAISGLVIFLTLEKCHNVRDFAALRFSRLYPTYWITLVAATLVGVLGFGDPFWLTGFVANLSMFQVFVGVSNFDNVYWSLAVELAFYLNVAWLFAVGLHRYPLHCVAGWLCLSAAWVMLADGVRAPDRDWFAIFTAADYAPYFAIGILFYRAHGRRWNAWEGAIVALALMVEFLIAGWEGLAVGAGVLALMYLAVSGHLSFMVGRVTLWLGSISYALYLIHRNIGYHVLQWLGDHHMDPVSAIVLTTAGALLLATLVTQCVERPASRFLRQRYRALTASRDRALVSS
ncbi:MAG: acyltransferase [Pseudomonadales bacterium]